jgi:hypothetical protein
MNYQIYNLIVDSDFSLTREALSSVLENKILIRCATPSETFQTPSQWFMQWHLPRGELWLSFAKLDGGYLLRFNELADFFVSNGGEKIIYKSKLGIPPNTIRHLLLDQVIPLVINLRGEEALHASAVLAPQGVIAFTGPAGSGKSTLAGNFLLSGYQHVSDDCLALSEKDQEIYAIPAYPGLRLWDDALSHLFGENGAHGSVAHYTDKRRVEIEKRLETHCKNPQPLRRLYTVADPTEAERKTDIIIEHLSSRESFMALVRYAFRLDITDLEMLIRQFNFLQRVAFTVSVRRLIFPRDFNILPAVREAILNDLKDLDN